MEVGPGGPKGLDGSLRSAVDLAVRPEKIWDRNLAEMSLRLKAVKIRAGDSGR